MRENERHKFEYNFLLRGKNIAMHETDPYFDAVLAETGRVPDGPVLEYHGDVKAVKAEMTYLNNRLHGEFKEYYQSGNLFTHCTYSNGMKHGVLRNYRDDGQIYQEWHYRAGKQWGTEKNWYSSGELDSVSEWVDGNLHGVSRTYHGNGSVRSQATFDHGKVIGEVLLYYENGDVQERRRYHQGEFHSRTEKEYHHNGQLKAVRTFEKDQRQGPVRESFDNGQLSSETPYTDDKVHGVAKTFFRNGQLRTETPYCQDRINGTAKEYAEDGKLLQAVSYAAGLLDGQSKYNHSDGKLKAVEEYRQGKLVAVSYHDPSGERIPDAEVRRDGIRREYFGPGRLKVECFYVDESKTTTLVREFDEKGRIDKEAPLFGGITNGVVRQYVDGWLWKETPYVKGKLHGETRMRTREGSLWEITEFDNDERISVKRYHPNGKLESEMHFRDGKEHGWHRDFFTNGFPQMECQYKHGKLVGPTTSFDETGWKRVEYELDDEAQAMTFRLFHPSGKLKATRTLKRGQFVDHDGKPMNGPLRTLHENGALESEVMLKDGTPAADSYAEFHANGQLKYKGTFIDDMPLCIAIENAYDDQGHKIDLPREASIRSLLY